MRGHDRARVTSMPASVAASSGASGCSSANGLMSAYARAGSPAACSPRASALRQAPSRQSQPLATGFMPTARRPRARKACSKAQLARVLPMPVSVPVT